MLASVERMVWIALGLSVTDKMRKVADCVNGASTRCDSIGVRRLIVDFVANLAVRS